jgi:hypothetical protein
MVSVDNMPGRPVTHPRPRLKGYQQGGADRLTPENRGRTFMPDGRPRARSADAAMQNKDHIANFARSSETFRNGRVL